MLIYNNLMAAIGKNWKQNLLILLGLVLVWWVYRE